MLVLFPAVIIAQASKPVPKAKIYIVSKTQSVIPLHKIH